MKKTVYVISKTHLDLGYTDLARNVLDRYLSEFIPNAVQTAQKLNSEGQGFVWTIGSWLAMQALCDSNRERAQKFEDAFRKGYIVAHAMPFTVQSELMDEKTAEYALSIIKELDKRFDRRTVSAKMTDVPGHTLGIVKVLARNGIKLLHIGVNASSAVPDVPPCFVWKCGEDQIVVIYEGSYGKTFTHPLLDCVLVFNHSMDNCGPSDTKKTKAFFDKIKRKYKGCEVKAASLDEIANALWKIKDSLPVVTSEIGDSWIHGVASDPYKYGAMWKLQQLRDEWLKSGEISEIDSAYRSFEDKLLCVAEHTCGMGILKGLRDYDNYTRENFEEARRLDARIKRYGIWSLPFLKKVALKRAKKGVYSLAERSWEEQRGYIDEAVRCLPDKLAEQAKSALASLIPHNEPEKKGSKVSAGECLSIGDWQMELNEYGALKNLSLCSLSLIKDNEEQPVRYHSVAPQEFSYWLRHYQRDLYKTFTWAIPDFARPKLRLAKYAKGDFGYLFDEAYLDSNVLTVYLKAHEKAFSTLGMPRKACMTYEFEKGSVKIKVQWFEKPANRLSEEIWLNMPFIVDKNTVSYTKLGQKVNPYDVVAKGSRNLSCTRNICFSVGKTDVCVKCNTPAPVSMGKGKLLRFDNVVGDGTNGFSFLLFDNIWGTNYPLWYSDNASFDWEVTVK